uniref:Uncharacterized protein n=1 Tax=Rhizophora mucronata TaxID=61149 RepID=A0A2P2QGM4_RHIMU
MLCQSRQSSDFAMSSPTCLQSLSHWPQLFRDQ